MGRIGGYFVETSYSNRVGLVRPRLMRRSGSPRPLWCHESSDMHRKIAPVGDAAVMLERATCRWSGMTGNTATDD